MKRLNINNQKLAVALRRMAPETGSLLCMGCGYERNCSLHGCAVLRTAADRLAELSAPPPNLTLTPEELQEMDGEPVWFQFDDFCGWSTVKYANSEFLATWRFGFLLWEEYEKTWTAYRRRPEKEET